MDIAVMGAAALTSFLPCAVNFTVGVFDKIGFDLDVIGRQREIARIEGRLRGDYANRGQRVNIAVWNMHVPMEHVFNNNYSKVISWELERMGDGGGFEVVVFQGNAYLQNKGEYTWAVLGNAKYSGLKLPGRKTTSRTFAQAP